MIAMSRFVALSAVLAAGAVGCDTGSHACSLIACFNGVTVAFTGLGAHASYDVTITPVTTTPDVASIATCTIDATDAGDRQLSCTSSSETLAVFGLSVRIQDDTLRSIQVTVSSGGAPVAQQTFDPTYQSTEPNGPGCGVCTGASVTMTVP